MPDPERPSYVFEYAPDGRWPALALGDDWDLTAQLRPGRKPPPGEGDWHGPLPELPPRWGERRPGDHDWTGPGGACASCRAASFLDTTGPCQGPLGCPDGGACHHECAPGACFRVHSAGPLSGTYPGDEWPPEVVSAWADGGVL